MGFFKKVFGGLKKTATAITTGIANIFTGTELNDDFYDELEFLLISADIGVEGVEQIIKDIKKHAKQNGIRTEEELKEALATSITGILNEHEEYFPQLCFKDKTKPTIVMVVGVNGVGKTTAIGKLSAHFKREGKSVVVAAADTFRAAATEQLSEWCTRAGVRIVKQGEGADAAAVVFDAISSFKAKNDNLLIIDTAGRLHNKAHLMEELKKIDRVVGKHFGEDEVNYLKLIALDATTGQNALSQVDVFNDAVDLDGVILTKLDGTAKGGIAIAIKQRFNLPVTFIGVGEKIDDLLPFDANSFARAIIGINES